MQKSYLDRSRITFITSNHLWNLNVMFGLDISTSFSRHVHDTFCIGLVTQGARLIKKSSETFFVPKDNIFLINPGEPHACSTPGKLGHNYIIISIGFKELQKIAGLISDKILTSFYFDNTVISDSFLSYKIKYLVEVIKSSDTAHLEKDTIVLDTFSQLINDQSSLNLHNPQKLPITGYVLKKICEYINDNFAENITLSQLSEISNLSPFHLQRSFLKAMGVTPYEYLMQIRFKKAINMMQHGHSLSETAYATGFADQSHFSRRFKQSIGVTPGRLNFLHTT